MNDNIIFNTEDSVRNGISNFKPKTFTLVSEHDVALNNIVPEFNFDNPPIDANIFASSLVETCRENNGYGLSANQCGFNYRVFVMGSGDEYVAFYNPKILYSTPETSMITEGCLSFPGLALKISRPKHIEVEYQDFNGVVRKQVFEGLTSHIFQHELDHLNGICYTERAKPMALKMGMKKRVKFNKLVHRYNLAQKVLNTVGK